MTDATTEVITPTETIGELQTASWWESLYPARYYAYSNTTSTLGGHPTVGWVDVSMFSAAPSWLPEASNMIALTQAEWDARSLVNQIVVNGAITTYTAPAPTLAEQASSAVTSARAYIYNNYGILNEPTPDAWVTYLKALMAIASGADTTSTALPTKPTDVMTTT